MFIKVLGSAAGGGFPQWNCNCDNCRAARATPGSPGGAPVRPRTQSSLIVGSGPDASDWLLVNASPDILAQIRATPQLQPARARRDSGIAAVLLMDAQIDHVTGLLMLRESARPLPIYATAPVLADLHGGLPLLDVLAHYCGTTEHPLQADGTPFSIAGLAGVSLRAIALDSKAPPYSPHRHDPHPGDNIGLLLTDTASGRTAFYAPGLGAIGPAVEQAIDEADVLLLDGTFWTEDEMLALGLSRKRAREMGHIPQSGPGNLLDRLARYPNKRRILIHINNSNPVLREDSPERAELDRLGIELAFDGLEIAL
ncbi:MAG: pyrroloquinoline quinone biosynthesis protein PqqB [Comamonas sp.]